MRCRPGVTIDGQRSTADRRQAACPRRATSVRQGRRRAAGGFHLAGSRSRRLWCSPRCCLEVSSLRLRQSRCPKMQADRDPAGGRPIQPAAASPARRQPAGTRGVTGSAGAMPAGWGRGTHRLSIAVTKFHGDHGFDWRRASAAPSRPTAGAAARPPGRIWRSGRGFHGGYRANATATTFRARRSTSTTSCWRPSAHFSMSKVGRMRGSCRWTRRPCAPRPAWRRC